jgi:predicted DNA-binding protein (MmcQ/YjbR family)
MNPPTIRADRLKRLRALCLSLPDAEEKEAWGDPTWRVRGRIFAMQKGNHAGGRPSLWLKAPGGAQAILVEANPGVVFVPPYVGHKGWIGLYLDGGRLDWGQIGELVETSHELISAPRRGRARGRPARRAGRP